MRRYEKPCMTVTYYDAMDKTNAMKLIATSAIAPYNIGKGVMSSESFSLHR